MKVTFIHTGDLHIGRQFHFQHNSDIFGRNKRVDIWNTFDKILNMAEKNQIDLLLIAGDFFDSAEIDVNEMHRAAHQIKRLTHTKVVILPGNHDYYSGISIYGLIDWPENVVIFKSGKMDSVYFPELETEIFGFGWQKNTYNEMPYKKEISLSETRNNILMLHGDVYRKQSDYMPLNVADYDHFDYVALGHIHKPDMITPRMAYCGSPEALDFGEKGNHGIIIGQIEDHHCVFKLIKTQQREYGSFQVNISPEMGIDEVKNIILDTVKKTDCSQNFYRIRLTGYCDPDLSLQWLYDELQNYFYYIELDDASLEKDLDIESILDENKYNVVGDFIREMQRYGDDPIAKKALYIGLEGILKEEKRK